MLLKFWLRLIYQRIRFSSSDSILEQLPGQCKFLQNQDEVEQCTAYLRSNGYVSHSLSCKDWDLAHVLSIIGDGNVLDMGSSDSYILKNLALTKRVGTLHGIDLREPDFRVPNVGYTIGDLTDTEYQDGSFDYITCLSVLEHGVRLSAFCAEVSRLLSAAGTIFLTFDYWNPKVTPKTSLYGLEWAPLDKQELTNVIEEFRRCGLTLTQDINWKSQTDVIRDGYFSPEVGVSYTFGLIVLRKAN